MKRSVAIENIINVLRLTGNHYCDNGRDEQDAEKILKRLEDIGMQPPENYQVHDNGMFIIEGWEE
jgi:hypothetical protein